MKKKLCAYRVFIMRRIPKMKLKNILKICKIRIPAAEK